MGKKWVGGFKPSSKDLVPFAHPARRIKELGADLKGPQAPGPTAAETKLQQRQQEEIARLDDQENIRIKRGQRGQLGSRRLLSSQRRGTTGGGAGSSAGGGRVGIPRRPGSGSYA